MTHQEQYNELTKLIKEYFSNESFQDATLKNLRLCAARCVKFFNEEVKRFNVNTGIDVNGNGVPRWSACSRLEPVEIEGQYFLTLADGVLKYQLHNFSPAYVLSWKSQKLNYLIRCTQESIKSYTEQLEKLKEQKLFLETTLKAI